MADSPVSDIIQSITDDVKLLVKDEIELAKAELVPSAKKAGIAGGMFGAAAYLALVASILLFITLALGLWALGLAPWLSFLIVAVLLLLVAGILGFVGYRQVQKVKAPERTIAQAQDAVSEISGAVKRANAAATAPQIEGTVVEPKAIR
jgi:membrane protein implicated in regulation of membrane protease activity